LTDQLTFWSEEPLANHSALPDFAKDLQTLGETSCSHLELLQVILNRPGLSGKTSPESCHQTKDGTLVPSSGCWGNSGMGSPIGFLTLNTSEWPKDAAVCSLLDTLETGDVPQRFFLSPKACSGILRRAEKRGKVLPFQLERALIEVVTIENPKVTTSSSAHFPSGLPQGVDSGPTSTSPEDCKSTTDEAVVKAT